MRYTIPGLLLLLLPCAVAQADDPGVETWDRMHISGAHSGYVHTITKKVEADGQARIVTHSTSDIKMKRMGATTEITSSSVTWETADGTLLRIESSQKMSAMETKTIFTFNGEGKVTVETTVMGNTRKVEVDTETDLKGPHFIEQATRKLAGTTDQVVSVKTFMADFQQAVTITLTSKGPEKTKLHDDSSPELTRVETAFDKLPAMKPIAWINADGDAIKSSMNMSGLQFETYRVGSKAEATGEGEEKKPVPDVFAQTLIREADPIPVPRRLERAWITVSLRKGDGVLPNVNAEGYTITKGEKTLEIDAVRAVPPSDKEGTRPLATIPDALKDAMAPSSMIQSDAEEIIKIANEVVGDETNAWKAAQKLESWVFENMTQKNFNVAFGSALEACRSREGDCTEHAVLLAALCRAAGIPARVVMGVEYLFGIWGGHAWNDVWIDGTWYQLDSTNGYGYVDPLHIPMAQMTMKEGGGSEFIEIMGSLGNIDVDITKVVRDGRTIVVNDSATLVTRENGRFRDAIRGIQFDAPAGFALGAPRKRSGMSARVADVKGKTEDGKAVQIRVDVMGLRKDTIESGMKSMKWTTADEATVDGRAARSKTETKNGRQIMRTIVASDGALFVFTLDRAEGAAERQAFDALIQSVDLDVK